MRFKGVIFDLFDTLIDFDEIVYRKKQREYLAQKNLDGELFLKAWSKSAPKALRGEYADIRQWYSEILMQIPHEEGMSINEVLPAERNALISACTLLDGVRDLLAVLALKGARLGLISNSSCIGVELIYLTGLRNFFHETVFSFREDVAKPDPSIYNVTCVRLQVDVDQAVYVSDGDKNELEGARKAGLHPVRFDPLGRFPHVKIPPGVPDFSKIDETANYLLETSAN